MIVPSSKYPHPITNEVVLHHTSDLANLSIDFGNGTIVSFSDANGTNVLEATESKVNVVVEWYGDLAYVVEIEGVHNDGAMGLYWQYWVNGERAPYAANNMPVVYNDTIDWKRVPSTFTTNNSTIQQIDSELTIGTILTTILGPGFLGVLYIVKKRRLENE